MTAKTHVPNQTDRHSAVQDLVRAIHARLETTGLRLDLSDLVAEFDKATNGSMPITAQQARALQDRHALKITQGAHSMAANLTAGEGLRGVIATADREIAEVDNDGLAKARQAVEKLEVQLRATVQNLQAAVGRGDIDDILRLRTQAEALIPAELAKARVVVVDREIEVATVAAKAPAVRASLAHQSLDQAQHRHDDAKAALEAAHADLIDANWWAGQAGVISGEHDSHLQALTSRREAMIRDAERDQTARMRQLAGLPEPVEVTA